MHTNKLYLYCCVVILVDGKTSTELVTEAISKGLKQDRTLRAKANANKESTLWWLLTQIKDLLIKFGIGNLTKWQVTRFCSAPTSCGLS